MKAISIKSKIAKLYHLKKLYSFAYKSLVFIAFVGIISSCNQKDESNIPVLVPIEIYDVEVPETSDLCFGSSKDILYTVSDNTARVYKLNTKGKVLSALSYIGNDPEGVCFVDNQYVYIAEERLRKVVKLDLQGNIVEQKTIPVAINEENSGLEGISYASFNSHFYIINETNPDLLIETDKNFNVLNKYSLNFAYDYSGIFVDNTNQQLWIVSDLSASVNKCNMQGELLESYRVPVTNPEGIAVDIENNKIYVISDAQSKLYIFNLNTNS